MDQEKGRGGREKGEGRRGEGGQEWEGKFRGLEGKEGKGVGKRGGRENLGGGGPGPQMFFLEPRLPAGVKRIRGVSRNALYKCTILTYLLTYLRTAL